MKKSLIRSFYLILYLFLIQLIVQLLQFYLIGEINPFKYLGNHIPPYLEYMVIILIAPVDKRFFKKSDIYLLLFSTIIYFGWIAYYTYKYYKN